MVRIWSQTSRNINSMSYSEKYLTGKVKKHWSGVYIQRGLVGINHLAFKTDDARKAPDCMHAQFPSHEQFLQLPGL